MAILRELKQNNLLQHDILTEFEHINLGSSSDSWNNLFKMVHGLAVDAYHKKIPTAELKANRILYTIYSGLSVSSQQNKSKNFNHYRFYQLKEILEVSWEQAERVQLKNYFDSLPAVREFAAWAIHNCQSHLPNIEHPLFPYLRDHANFNELREFTIQTIPSDILFDQLIALTLLRIYDETEVGLLQKFESKIGSYNVNLMNHQLRIDMMRFLGIASDVHLSETFRFCTEQLKLANLYSHVVVNCNLLQGIGIVLASDLMISNQLEQQIFGWRRLGLSDKTIQYLIKRNVISNERGYHWLEQIVKPLLYKHPNLMPEIALGVARRLDYARTICNRMFTWLPYHR